MTEPIKREGRPELEELQLNRETVQDLTESDSEQAKGGQMDNVVKPVTGRSCNTPCS